MTGLVRTTQFDERAWTGALQANEELYFIALVNCYARDVFMVLYMPVPRLVKPPADDVLLMQRYEFLVAMMQTLPAYEQVHEYTMDDAARAADATVTLLGNGRGRARELVDA